MDCGGGAMAPPFLKLKQKFIMLTDVNTKEFWEQVKKEYQPDGYKYGLCCSSDTFSTMWNILTPHSPDETVIEQARVFVSEKSITVKYISVGYLFDDSSITTEQHVQIRRDFLDYMINKFS